MAWAVATMLAACGRAKQWMHDLGTPWNPADIGCGDIAPSVGTTATPVIDSSTDTVYLTHKTYVSGTAAWFMDALDVATGQERTGFPVRLGGTADNNSNISFLAANQQQRPGLLLIGGVVYAGFGGHCDIGPYQGWVFGVSTTTAQITAKWVDTAGHMDDVRQLVLRPAELLQQPLDTAGGQVDQRGELLAQPGDHRIEGADLVIHG